jgi:hypothetical protein
MPLGHRIVASGRPIFVSSHSRNPFLFRPVGFLGTSNIIYLGFAILLTGVLVRVATGLTGPAGDLETLQRHRHRIPRFFDLEKCFIPHIARLLLPAIGRL